jgi:MFS family permease
LGGEWGGAVLLATENAPPGKEAWYGCFPQLGAPLGFLCSTGVFLLLSSTLSEAQFLAWGWRVPFLASAGLVFVGLSLRLRLVETPQFKLLTERGERVRVPLLTVISRHARPLILGTLAAAATFLVFYLMTVFTLFWATSRLGFARKDFLILLMIGVLFFGATIPVSALLADRIGARLMLILASIGLFALGFTFQPVFGAGTGVAVLGFLALGLALTGLTYGPLGSCLAALFPTSVRYTGASLTFNLAGIVGAALSPRIAATLATEYGLRAVGWYLSTAAAISLAALLVLGRLSAARGTVAA